MPLNLRALEALAHRWITAEKVVGPDGIGNDNAAECGNRLARALGEMETPLDLGRALHAVNLIFEADASEAAIACAEQLALIVETSSLLGGLPQPVSPGGFSGLLPMARLTHGDVAASSARSLGLAQGRDLARTVECLATGVSVDATSPRAELDGAAGGGASVHAAVGVGASGSVYWKTGESQKREAYEIMRSVFINGILSPGRRNQRQITGANSSDISMGGDRVSTCYVDGAEAEENPRRMAAQLVGQFGDATGIRGILGEERSDPVLPKGSPKVATGFSEADLSSIFGYRQTGGMCVVATTESVRGHITGDIRTFDRHAADVVRDAVRPTECRGAYQLMPGAFVAVLVPECIYGAAVEALADARAILRDYAAARGRAVQARSAAEGKCNRLLGASKVQYPVTIKAFKLGWTGGVPRIVEHSWTAGSRIQLVAVKREIGTADFPGLEPPSEGLAVVAVMQKTDVCRIRDKRVEVTQPDWVKSLVPLLRQLSDGVGGIEHVVRLRKPCVEERR